MFRNLRTQFFWMFLFVSILTLIALGASTTRFGSEILKQSSLDRNEFATKALQHEFEKGIIETIKVVNILEDAIKEYLERESLTTETDVIEFLNWIDPIVRRQAQAQQQSKTAYVYIDPYLFDKVFDIYYADENNDGVVEKQSNIPLSYYAPSTKDDPDKSWWFRPQMNGLDHWTAPYDWTYDNGTAIQFVSYTRPIYYKGVFLGVIGTDLAYDIVEERIKNFEDLSLGDIFLINDQNHMLIPSHENAVQDLFAKDKIVFSTKLINNWTIGISTSEAIVFAPLRQFENLLLLIGIIIGFSTAFISILFSGYLSRPLNQMEHAVNDSHRLLAPIELPAKLISRKDEIGSLARSLLDMSQQIKRDLSMLEMQDQALTSEHSIRKAVETKLQLITKTLEHSDNGIFITDAQYQIIYANKTFESITGYKLNLESNLLHQCGIFISDQQKSLLETGHVLQGEFEQLRSNSASYPMQLYVTRIIDDSIYYLGLFKDLTEVKLKDQHLNYLRYYDPTTQLPNKTLFIDSMDKMLKIVTLLPYVCLLINIDNFRILNGLLGIEVCDLMLKQFSDRLSTFEKSHGIVARTEGDEFGVFYALMPGQSYIERAKALQQHLTKPYFIESDAHHITVSIGLSTSPENGNTSEQLVKNANIALNHAKNNGKNQILKYDDAIETLSSESYELLKHIRFALDRGEMYLNFQPQVDTQTGRVIGGEALLRWELQGKIISPSKFIPLAEQTRLIIPMGDFVLKETFKAAEHFYKMGEHITLAINVSVEQLKWDLIFAQVLKYKKTFNFPNETVEFEVTESILLTVFDEAIEVIRELQAMGFRIAIDDFGTGYSSLSYLKRFPFERIKMDRSFIKDYPSTDDGNIARLILNLANSMNIEIVAEGVETIEQLDFLKSHHCRIIQGYYYSQPLSKSDFFHYVSHMNK